MHNDVDLARRSLAGAAERAEAIASALAALSEDPTATAVMAKIAVCSDPPRAELRNLQAHPHPTRDDCAEAANHLGELDRLLSLGIQTGAESCARLADRLAALEEFALAPRGASQRAVTLGARLVQAGA